MAPKKVVTSGHNRTLFVDKINVFRLRITGLETDNRTLRNRLISRHFAIFLYFLSNTFYNVFMRFITPSFIKSGHEWS